ncbi:long-chain-fatty-acid--CoA ligase [compost metagenome]
MVCAAGESLDQQAIEVHLQQFVASGHINKWAIPRQIRFVADIPKTSVGKINKKLIRENELATVASHR